MYNGHFSYAPLWTAFSLNGLNVTSNKGVASWLCWTVPNQQLAVRWTHNLCAMAYRLNHNDCIGYKKQQCAMCTVVKPFPVTVTTDSNGNLSVRFDTALLSNQVTSFGSTYGRGNKVQNTCHVQIQQRKPSRNTSAFIYSTKK